MLTAISRNNTEQLKRVIRYIHHQVYCLQLCCTTALCDYSLYNKEYADNLKYIYCTLVKKQRLNRTRTKTFRKESG